MSSEKQQNSFDTTYGSYLSERSMQSIDLETLDLDASAPDLELPVGAQCCTCICVAVYKLKSE